MPKPLKKQEDQPQKARSDNEPADQVAGSIEGAEATVATMLDRVTGLETQLHALEQIRPLMTSLQDHAERLEGTQRRTDVRLERAADAAEKIQAQMDELTHSADMALGLKKDLEQYEHLIPRTKEHLGDLDALSSNIAGQVKALKEHGDAIKQAVDAAKQLDDIAQHIEEIGQRQQDQSKTSGELDAAMTKLQSEVADRAAKIRSRQVQLDAQDQATLEELAAIRAAVRKSLEQVEFSNKEFDSVNRRVVEMRGAVEDLGRQFIPLHESRESAAQLESKIKGLAERLSTIADGSGWIEKIEARVEDVQSLNAEALERSEKVTARQREIDDGVKSALEALAAVRQDIEKTVQNVEISNRGFDSVSRQIDQLREALEDFEERLGSLDKARHELADLHAQTDNLADRLTAVSDGDGGLTDLEVRITAANTLQSDISDRAEQIVSHQANIAAEVQSVRDELAELRKEVEGNAELLETANSSADSAVQRVDALDGPLNAAEERLRSLNRTQQSIADVDGRADALAERLEAIAKGDGGVSDVEAQLSQVRSTQREIVERAERISTRQEEMYDAAHAAREQLDALREDVQRNVERADTVHRDFDSVNDKTIGLREDLNDFESRLRALDESRTVIEDVESRATGLDERLNAIATGDGGVGELETRLADATSRQAEIRERSERIAARHDEVENAAKAAHDQLEGLREDVDKNVERIDVANTEFGSLSKQTGGLREELDDFETRLRGLDTSRQTIADVRQEADELAKRFVAIVNDCERIDKESERIQGLFEDVARIETTVGEIDGRVESLGAIRDEVDAVSNKMSELLGADQSIRRAMEQAQLAHDEIVRMRDGQSKTESWFTQVQESLQALHGSVQEVDRMKPAVASVREEAERVTAAVTNIGAHRELLEEMDKRLGELESLGTRLEFGEGARSTPHGSGIGKASWHLGSNMAFTWSTWEFGLQLRLAGRWKRGLAVWLGPIRWFIGWEKLIGPGGVDDRSTVEPHHEDLPELVQVGSPRDDDFRELS